MRAVQECKLCRSGLSCSCHLAGHGACATLWLAHRGSKTNHAPETGTRADGATRPRPKCSQGNKQPAGRSSMTAVPHLYATSKEQGNCAIVGLQRIMTLMAHAEGQVKRWHHGCMTTPCLPAVLRGQGECPPVRCWQSRYPSLGQSMAKQLGGRAQHAAPGLLPQQRCAAGPCHTGSHSAPDAPPGSMTALQSSGPSAPGAWMQPPLPPPPHCRQSHSTCRQTHSIPTGAEMA